MNALFQDLRFGLRMLAKNPGFTSVAVLTLALGIGANTALFSVIDAMLLRPLPVKEPRQLIHLATVGPVMTTSSFSYPAFKRFRDENQVFSGVLAVFWLHELDAMVSDQTESIDGQLVSGNFFSLLGVDAVVGRTFTADEAKALGQNPVALIGYGYWKRRFALDPSVVGKSIRLNKTRFTILGVTPPDFSGIWLGHPADVYVPMMMEPAFHEDESWLNERNYHWIQIMARLKPGVSRKKALADLAVIHHETMEDEPKTDMSPQMAHNFMEQKLELVAASSGLTFDLRHEFSQPLYILMAMVGLVLLVACTNVANLLLARETARQKEIAVRLAIGAGRLRLIRQLLTESLCWLRPAAWPAGFSRQNVLLFSVDATKSGNKGADVARIYEQLLERFEAIPGVRSASLSLWGPITGGGGWDNGVWVEGYTPRPNEDMTVYLNAVGRRYFETIGTPVMLGREFAPRDSGSIRKVAIINQTMAKYFFGTGNPIGRRFGWGRPADKDREVFEIVGVVKDSKYGTLRETVPITAYVNCFQRPLGGMTFLVRTSARPAALISQIRAEILAAGKDLRTGSFSTLEEHVDTSLGHERLMATLSSLFGGLALLLACIGLYGVLSYAMARRTKEIGVRMALGARQSGIFWMVLRETLLLIAIGIAIGVPGALAASRLIKGLLFGLTPTDPVTIVACTLVLIVVALVAGYLPARRAAKVDPLVALRYE